MIKKKPGRPPKKSAQLKRVAAYLDEARVKQLAELTRLHKKQNRLDSESATISQAISFHHAHFKKESPDDLR